MYSMTFLKEESVWLRGIGSAVLASNPPSPLAYKLTNRFTASHLGSLICYDLHAVCDSREVKYHVYVTRQTRTCTTWPSFPFTCRLLFIISTHKLVVSRNFLSIRIVLSCFYRLIFYFEKFWTWISWLPFVVFCVFTHVASIYANLLEQKKAFT